MRFIDNIDDINVLSQDEYLQKYNEVLRLHAQYLRMYNVRMPNVNTTQSIQLVYLYDNMGDAVHKDLISELVNRLIPTAGKDQQVRHLGTQFGWNILNRHEMVPGTNIRVKSGFNMLFDYRTPKSSFYGKELRRIGRIAARDFESLKLVYNNKCATCGAEEGKLHHFFRDKVVQLQQGHMNPNLPLTLDNTIPQCQVCNQIYQDLFEFNEQGQVSKLNNPEFIRKSDRQVREAIYELLKPEFE